MAKASATVPESSDAFAPIVIEIDADKPFEIKEVAVEKIEASPASFAEFIETAEAARFTAEIEKVSGGVALLREQIARQAKAITANGDKVSLTPDVTLMMPRRYAGKLRDAVNSFDGLPGEIISGQDAIDAPVLYKLGRSIKVKEGSITELEFKAETYGAIEEVLAESGDMAQALKLIEICAKPVGKGIKAAQLHEAMMKQISLADGVFIQTEILPSFLE